jgi:alcohol dehydrogenase class IV
MSRPGEPSESAPLSHAELCSLSPATTALWCSAPVAASVKEMLPYTHYKPLLPLPDSVNTLVVVGGGTLIDRAKFFRARNHPTLRLWAVPSLYGSGSEVSPIAVLDWGGVKEIHMGMEFLPDAYGCMPELAGLAPAHVRHWGRGDIWAHALEALLSPLASSTTTASAARLLHDMLAQPVTDAAQWFERSANACRLQVASSVGLVHGMAHTLEPVLRAAHPEQGWGHARLCALLLAPVFNFNRLHADKVDCIFQPLGLSAEAVRRALSAWFVHADYDLLRPHLASHWMTILRDRCTRTNGVLVKPSHLPFFAGYAGSEVA